MFYRGFNPVDQSLDATFATDTGVITQVGGNGTAQAGDVSDLRGFKHHTNAAVAIGANDDNYDVLAKAVMGYNSGEGYADDYTWAKYLKFKEYNATSNRNAEPVCHSCRYNIEVREKLFGHDNLRTFIWFGGMYPANYPDATLAGQDYCFAYGEKEWIAGDLFQSVRDSAIGLDSNTGLPIPIQGRLSCP